MVIETLGWAKPPSGVKRSRITSAPAEALKSPPALIVTVSVVLSVKVNLALLALHRHVPEAPRRCTAFSLIVLLTRITVGGAEVASSALILYGGGTLKAALRPEGAGRLLPMAPGIYTLSPALTASAFGRSPRSSSLLS